MKKLFLVIDMQNDFIDGALGTAEAINIVEPLRACLEEVSKDKNTDIFFTLDTHTDNYLSTAEGKKLPVPHCIKGSKGWEISPLLQPYTKEATLFEKPTFGSTELAPAVKDYDSITIAGLCTDICVISNALLLKAFYPEKEIIVDSRLCAGVTPESHENALNAMKMCHIDVI